VPHHHSAIQRAAFSAIISVGLLVLPLVMVGMAPASTTRRPAISPPAPSRTRRRGVEHGHRVVVAPHLGGAHRVEDGAGDVAGQARQFLVALVLHAGLVFLGREARHGRLGHDAARHAQAVGGDLAVLVGAEVVGGDGRRVVEALRW
jgi:hypothetical protein